MKPVWTEKRGQVHLFIIFEKEHIALNILRSSLVKPHILSFPQVERVGNPSENKERFRTSRNDRVSGHVALLSFSLVSHRLSSLRTISAIILWLKFIH